jgi:hypothetical protein
MFIYPNYFSLSMAQLSLFPRLYPLLEAYEATPSTEQMACLEDMASTAHILVRHGFQRRFGRSALLTYFHGKDSHAEYLITANEELVGYIAVFKGWDLAAEEQTKPVIDLAIIKDSYRREQPQLRSLFCSILKEVEERHGGW